MAYWFYIDPAVDCVFIEHFGAYDIGEGMASIENFVLVPSYHKEMSVCRDFSRTTLPDSFDDSAMVKEARKRMKSTTDLLSGNCKIAFIVASAKDFGIMHRYTVSYRLGTLAERRPFRDIAKARTWLGIPDNYEIDFANAE